MKERPIIFNAEMVRAILDGRKTQTRREVKPQPLWVYDNKVPVKTEDADPKGAIKCPFGQPGDRLWVRETWFCEQDHGLDYSAVDGRHMNIFYRATNPDDAFFYLDPETGERVNEGPDFRWCPSIHMPRWASRITLEIVSVRVERLQEISEKDALAEGGHRYGHNGAPVSGRYEFKSLWRGINGPNSWDANPWVWVVEFRRVEQERLPE